MSPLAIATDEEYSSQSSTPPKIKDFRKGASEKDNVGEESFGEELSTDEDYFEDDEDGGEMSDDYLEGDDGMSFDSEGDEDDDMDEGDISDYADDPMTVMEHPFEQTSEDEEVISLSNILPADARRRQH